MRFTRRGVRLISPPRAFAAPHKRASGTQPSLAVCPTRLTAYVPGRANVYVGASFRHTCCSVRVRVLPTRSPMRTCRQYANAPQCARTHRRICVDVCRHTCCEACRIRERPSQHVCLYTSTYASMCAGNGGFKGGGRSANSPPQASHALKIIFKKSA